MRVLIVGAGIAGLTLAFILERQHHDVVVIERASRARSSGYMIDFFGSGYDVAERLGMLGDLEKIHYAIGWLSFRAPSGETRFRVNYATMRKLLGNRHYNFMRGELEDFLLRSLSGRAQIRFGTAVDSFADEGDRVAVALDDGSVETADLLVGADGVHSRVRAIAFGEEEKFVRHLGYHTAAFTFEDAATHLEIGNTFATLTVPGRQLALYPIRGGRIATFFVHRSDEPITDSTPAAAVKELRAVYGGLGWLVPKVLDEAERATSIYFDSVSQVIMPKWTSGRVVLLGDACQCVSLLAGQGASMAMGSAYVLAEELELSRGALSSALERYEERIRPAILKKQKAGRGIARWFVPEGRVRLALRDAALRASSTALGGWLLRRQIAGESVIARA